MAEKIKILLQAADKTKAAFKSVNTSMEKMKKSSKLMAAALGPLGAFAAAGSIVMIGKQSIQAADEIQKMSKRLSVSTEALSQYRHVADLSGTNFESLAKAISKSQRAIADADDGLSTAVRAIDDMNLSLEDLKKLKPEEAFEKMGQALSDIKDPYTKASVAAAVFGRAGKDLIPIFEDGADSVKAMRAEADRLGLTLTQDMADAAAEAADAGTRLSSAWKGFANTLTIAVAPALTDVANSLSGFGLETSVNLQQLEKDFPEIHKQIRILALSAGGLDNLSGEFVRLSVEALKTGEAFSLITMPDFDAIGPGAAGIFGRGPDLDPSGPGMRDSQAATAVQALKDEAIAAQALSEKYFAINEQKRALVFSGAQLADATKNFQAAELEGLELTADELERFNLDVLQGVDNMYLLADASDVGADALEGVGDAASESAQLMAREGEMAAQTFGDAIVGAAIRGEDALESLGNVAMNVFSSIISGFIGMGISSLFNPAAPIIGAAGGGGFIGQVNPLGAVATGGSTTNIENMTVNANSTLSPDPMSIRKLAMQLKDELVEVGRHQS